jgi:peptide subunit release factor 1 (eRF1)
LFASAPLFTVRRHASIGRQFTHCPSCDSDLLQVESLCALASPGTMVERRCPDCGHGDALELTSADAERLCRHAAELAAELRVLADRLEAGGELLFPTAR